MSQKSREQFIAFFAALVAAALVVLTTPSKHRAVSEAAAIFLGVAGLGLGNALLSKSKFSIALVACLIAGAVAFTLAGTPGFSGPPNPPDHRIIGALDEDGNLLPLPPPVPEQPSADQTLPLIFIAALAIVATYALSTARVPLHRVFVALIAEIAVSFLVLFLVGNLTFHAFHRDIDFCYFCLPSILLALATYLALRAGSRVMQAEAE